MSSPATYRAAVVGLGFVGAGDQVSGDALGQNVANLDGTHAPALNGHPRVTLVAGASRDGGRRRRFTEREGVAKTYADWREMLEQESLDIVSVATNTPYHAKIGIACAEAGARCVFTEKPIATRLCDADRLIDACQRHGALLVVNHNRRWAPIYQMVKKEIANGAIGAIHQIVTHWTSGRMGNVGTHSFDAIRYLTGLDPAAVSGQLDRTGSPDCRGEEYSDPGGWGVVMMERGVKLFVDATEARTLPWLIRVVGDDGQVSVIGKTARIERWDGGATSLQAPEDSPDSVSLAVDEIVRCLDGGGTPTSTGEDGRQTLEMIVGFHVSDRLGGKCVELPIQGKDRELEVRIG